MLIFLSDCFSLAVKCCWCCLIALSSHMFTSFSWISADHIIVTTISSHFISQRSFTGKLTLLPICSCCLVIFQQSWHAFSKNAQCCTILQEKLEVRSKTDSWYWSVAVYGMKDWDKYTLTWSKRMDGEVLYVFVMIYLVSSLAPEIMKRVWSSVIKLSGVISQPVTDVKRWPYECSSTSITVPGIACPWILCLCS